MDGFLHASKLTVYGGNSELLLPEFKTLPAFLIDLTEFGDILRRVIIGFNTDVLTFDELHPIVL
jgi:hypothetical protein